MARRYETRETESDLGFVVEVLETGVVLDSGHFAPTRIAQGTGSEGGEMGLLGERFDTRRLASLWGSPVNLASLAKRGIRRR